jgi:hypothetical protein
METPTNKKRKLDDEDVVNSQEKTNPSTPPGTPPSDQEMVSKAQYDQLLKAQDEIMQKIKSDVTKMRNEYKKKM